jgi:hypothetical protein
LGILSVQKIIQLGCRTYRRQGGIDARNVVKRKLIIKTFLLPGRSLTSRKVPKRRSIDHCPIMLSVTQARARAESMETKDTSPNRERSKGVKSKEEASSELNVKTCLLFIYKLLR